MPISQKPRQIETQSALARAGPNSKSRCGAPNSIKWCRALNLMVGPQILPHGADRPIQWFVAPSFTQCPIKAEFEDLVDFHSCNVRL